jgi:hypothetical protein
MLDDEYDYLLDMKTSAYFGYTEFKAGDAKRFEELSKELDRLDRMDNNHSGTSDSLRKFALRFNKGKPLSKRDKKLLSKVDPTTIKSVNFRKLVESVKTNKDDHAMIVPGGPRTEVKVADLAKYYSYEVTCSESGKRVRGVKVRLGDKIGVLCSKHLLDAFKSNVESVSIHCRRNDESVVIGNKKYTQILEAECPCGKENTTNCRIRGGDAILIMDTRIPGKTVPIGHFESALPIVFAYPGVGNAWNSVIGTIKDVGATNICDHLKHVFVPTDINHGASGGPFFQWQNGQCVLVAINKGVDPNFPEVSLVQSISNLNFKSRLGSTGLGNARNMALLPCQPGQTV